MTTDGRVRPCGDFGLLLFWIAASVALIFGSIGKPKPVQGQSRAPIKIRPPQALPVTSFYDTPRPWPEAKAGTLVRSEAITQYELPYELTAFRILYHSRTGTGKDVPVSGAVLIPDGQPPAGGWPVIAWAHDFRGMARQCAPSLMRNLGVGPILSMYANLGFAVVVSDYAGLGTDSGTPVLDMESNAQDVIHSIPAARAALPQVGAKWIAVGAYEGALAAVGVAENDEHDPNYLGSISTSGLADAQSVYSRLAMTSSSHALLALASTIKSLYPEFRVQDMLKEKASPAYNRLPQSCGSDSAAAFTSEMLNPEWEHNRFVKEFFTRNTPGKKRASGPMLVISGEADPNVPGDMTTQAVARMCKQGDQVLFLKYPNLDSSGVMGASASDQISWIKARFAGYAPPGNCH